MSTKVDFYDMGFAEAKHPHKTYMKKPVKTAKKVVKPVKKVSKKK